MVVDKNIGAQSPKLDLTGLGLVYVLGTQLSNKGSSNPKMDFTIDQIWPGLRRSRDCVELVARDF